AHPAIPEVRRHLAEVYRLIGDLLGAAYNFEGRLEYHRLSLDHLRRLPGAPNDNDLRSLLFVLTSTADTLDLLERRPEALTTTREVVALAERLVATRPAVGDLRLAHARALFDLGTRLS